VKSDRLIFWIGPVCSFCMGSQERKDGYPRYQGQFHFPESRTLALSRRNDRDPAPCRGNSSVCTTLCKLNKETHEIIHDFSSDLWAGYLSRYSYWLRAGRSGDRIPVGATFFAPVQTGPGAHPASCTMGTGSCLGLKSGRGVTSTPHLLLMPCL
jgi:hypothetical protein